MDARDYELAVTQKQSQVVNADYNLKLELGHQEVAKREWSLLNGSKPAKSSDLELALRKPHLDKAKADLAAAKAELKQAKINLPIYRRGWLNPQWAEWIVRLGRP